MVTISASARNGRTDSEAMMTSSIVVLREAVMKISALTMLDSSVLDVIYRETTNGCRLEFPDGSVQEFFVSSA